MLQLITSEDEIRDRITVFYPNIAVVSALIAGASLGTYFAGTSGNDTIEVIFRVLHCCLGCVWPLLRSDLHTLPHDSAGDSQECNGRVYDGESALSRTSSGMCGCHVWLSICIGLLLEHSIAYVLESMRNIYALIFKPNSLLSSDRNILSLSLIRLFSRHRCSVRFSFFSSPFS